MMTLTKSQTMPIEKHDERGPQHSERCRLDSENTNDSGLGVSRHSSNASSRTVPGGTASQREKQENDNDNATDCNETKRNNGASVSARLSKTTRQRVDSTKTACSNDAYVPLTSTVVNGIESRVAEGLNGIGPTNRISPPISVSGNRDKDGKNCAKLENSVFVSKEGNKKRPDLNTLHEDVSDINSVHKRSMERFHDENNTKLVTHALETRFDKQQSFDVESNRTASSYKACHRKNNSYSCESETDSELAFKVSRAKRRRYYSEGHAESEQLLTPTNQHSGANKCFTNSTIDCCDSFTPVFTIDNNAVEHSRIKATSEYNFVKHSADEDIDSIETFKINEDANFMDNQLQADRDGSDSSSFRAEQQRQSEPSEHPSPTLTNARQEHDTRLTELSGGNSDLEDQAKHSTTVKVDKDNFESDTETCDPLLLVDTENDNNENCDKKSQCQCCSACSDHYAELHSKIDDIIHDYQWAANRLDAMKSSTRDLKVFKGRATKVGAVTLAVMLILVCGSAATSVVREQLYGSGVASQMFGQNITTWIAELHEQYVSVSDMVNDLMTRSKSVIHLTNGGRMASHGGSYFVRWKANGNHGQGSLVLSDDGDFILAPTGGYYRISAKIHYKATVDNTTNVKLEYDLVRSSGGHIEPVRHAIREFPMASGSLQYELQLDTTLYVYPQDAILISVRPDQMRYLANFDNAHEFTMLEVG